MEKVKKMLEFIDDSPTMYHVVDNTKKILEENNFIELKKEEKWRLENGKNYYVINERSSLVAFTLKDIEKGFNIIGAHTDSPMIKIKPNPVVITDDNYASLNVEVYGGPILHTWFDRGLSIAGKAIIKENGKIVSRLIDAKKTLLTIPSVAIHLSREFDSAKIDKQSHLKPIISLINEELTKDDYLYNVIVKELSCKKSDILDFELYIYDNQKGEIFGLNNEFAHSKYFDDLLMAYAGVEAIVNVKNNRTKVLILTDNEEIGSHTATGAQSAFFENVFERIFLALGKTREDMFVALAKSISLSGDLAHAYHPNYKDKHDETNRPVLGKGIVIKYSANKSYSTDSYHASIFKDALNNKGLKYQTYVNNSNIRGGSTIGPMLSRKFGISAIDCGSAVLGMHSVRECASTYDIINTIEALECFFEIGE